MTSECKSAYTRTNKLIENLKKQLVETMLQESHYSTPIVDVPESEEK